MAIVGMACRFPGARDLATFWENVLAGRDSTGDVPPSRWDPGVFFDPDSKANDRVYCRRGGYLDEPIEFDPTRAGIMPIAVDGGEPESLLVLDAARAALDDAGLGSGLPPGARAEVVIGRGNYFNRGNLTRLQHGRILAQTAAILDSLHPEWTDEQRRAVREDLKSGLPPFESGTIAGQLTNATAGRIAERLDLSGASYVVDAASASSLVALDLGARSLAEGRADLALVGGVYLQTDVDFPLVFCRLGALSRSGRARPFSRGADGTLPGEGVGVVVLKRLDDAERDGDRVYAVVKGVGLASDGRGAGLAAPSARGHLRAIRRAYRSARIDPATVTLVEGHGLGVPASDRAELRALFAAFPRPARGGRFLGSVTSLIGHAMPAAGVAGLIKTALALHHRVLPPSSDADEPHAMLSEPDAPVALNARCRPWVHGHEGYPRRTGVNAFGFAGINAHAVLEEHARSADSVTPGCMPRWETEAVLLGAADRSSWVAVAGELLAWLEAGHNLSAPLKDLAYTLNCGRDDAGFRVGLVASSTSDLHGKLRAALNRIAEPDCRSVRDARGTYFWSEPLGGPGRLAFLYPGEGSQYPGMLADLCPHFPEVRAQLDDAERVAIERGLQRLPSEQLFDPAHSRGGGIWAMGTAINVVLSTDWALQQILSGLELRPDAVVGHSSGELIALAAAGVVRVDRHFADRLGDLGTLFEAHEVAGNVPVASLVAAATDREKVEAACAEVGGGVRVAMDNCPHQVVVAGDPRAVSAVVERLRGQGVICEDLPFRRAYHTPRFADALVPIREFFQDLPMAPPGIRVYSCAAAGPAGPDSETIRRLAVEQWVSPVAFRSTVEAMYADGVRLFVEVGARGSLVSYVEDTLRGRPHFACAANLPRRSGPTQLNHLVAALYAHGVQFRPDYLYARRRPVRIDFSADYPVPPPGRALAVGFPEMKLSPEVAARLGGFADTPPAPDGVNGTDKTPWPTHRFPPRLNDSTAGEPGPITHDSTRPQGSNGTAAGNGHSGHGFEFEAVAEAPDVPWSRRNGHETNGAVADQRVPGDVTNETTARTSTDSDAAMLSYFATMNEFLELQRTVVEAYLGGVRRPELTPQAVEPHRPTDADPDGREADPVARTETTEAATRVTVPEPPRAEAADVASVLLERVGKRTGYPREMLGLDLDMEGELGIDSIKRVEILGELQELGLIPDGTDMERLARCRTLGQVVEALGKDGPRATVHSPSSVAPTPGWVGEVVSFVSGRELVALRTLDAATDPVAANHTLGGRRLSAVEPGRLGLPVIPFTVMAELLAQAAAELNPGRVVIGFRDLQANRWIRYEDGPFELELRATRDEGRPDEVRASLRPRGTGGVKQSTLETPAVEGVVVFAARREPAEAAPEFRIDEPGRCRFTAEELYRQQWLFHGPALQAVREVGAISRHGVEGSIRVLPRRDLFPERDWPTLHTDPIVLDAFTHLLGGWGIDKRAGEEGDVMFPLRLASLTIRGDDPPEGALVDCRISVLEVSRHRVRVDADLLAPGGRVWVAIRGWEDWRFYWPGRYRDVFRQPDTVLVGEPVEPPGAPRPMGGVVGVWLEPPADMGKPVWRDVFEWVQLAPEERRAIRAAGEDDPASTLRIWERIAAKEAARRIGLARGEPPVFPADLVIEPGPSGRYRVRSLLDAARSDLPSIAFASTDGVAVGLAAVAPGLRLGVAVRRLGDANEATLRDSLRAWVERLTAPGDGRHEWIARLQSAGEAAFRAVGVGPAEEASGLVLVDADRESGDVVLRVSVPTGRRSCAATVDVRCGTARRGDYVWSWTALEGDGS